MTSSVFEPRINKLLGILAENDIDAFLVTPSSDMKYLCGYSINGDERFLALVLSPGHEPFIVANILYELQVTETPVEEYAYWFDGSDPTALLYREFEKRGIRAEKIAVDASMPARFTVELIRCFSGAEIINGSPFVQNLRVFKDRSELDLMIEASQIAEKCLQKVISAGIGWLGKKETDLQASLLFEMMSSGMSDNGALVAVGEGAAVPHHYSGNAQIRTGGCLLIDFGGTYGNYNSDMTRTYHFGRPTQKFRDVYNIVLEANLAGEEAAKAGNTLQDVDRAARSVISKYGYGDYFIHRTGHGIGIDCHEGPSAGEGETTVIRPGMCFSCEPGIYLPGEFGVRIEDLVAIELDGSTRILNSLPKELTIIEHP